MHTTDAILCLPALSHSFIAHAFATATSLWRRREPIRTSTCAPGLASGTAALACVFLGVTVDRSGRRGILLLSMTPHWHCIPGPAGPVGL